jgi:GT2 family glycosyltransferase
MSGTTCHPGLVEATYNLIPASDAALPASPPSFLDAGIDASQTVKDWRAAVTQRDGDIQRLQGELQDIGEQLTISTAHIQRLNDHIRRLNSRSIWPFLHKWKPSVRSKKRLAAEAVTISLSPFFDTSWYLAQYPDLTGLDIEPASHYADVGWKEGRQPSPLFDGLWYLKQNPDVAAAGVNPLVHYTRAGWVEGRPIRDLASSCAFGAPTSSVQPFRPAAPLWEEFEELAAHKGPAYRLAPCVDVIVPVYRGYDETFACLRSILRSKNRTPFELIVIDDCSPEPKISHSLNRLANLGLITLIKNESNVGFVGAVNHGMALHPDRDVLLLNSDTLVFNDWLDKLRMHASGDVATVTPFTNNGTICSYPVFFHDNNTELELSFEELDRLAIAANKGSYVEIPTGVGFCIYIVRRALSHVGFFDEASFGKGYGEENDFCMRAQVRGWRNLHALDTFVFHSGETSFSGDARQRKKEALARVCKLHPNYPQAVQTYIERDPVRAARASLDLARLLLGRFPNAAVLHFTHVLGPDNERYLRNRTKLLRNRGGDMILALPSAPGSNCIRLTNIDAKSQFHNLAPIDLKRDKNILKELLSKLKTQNIEVHGTEGWPVQFLNAVGELAAECGLQWAFVAEY